MTPITPTLPGVDLPIVIYAKDQPEYLPLPAYRMEDGNVVTLWKFSWKERLRLLLTGKLWHEQLTFNHPLQPTRMSVACPLRVE